MEITPENLAVKADVLESRGTNNSLHDINQAAHYLRYAAAFMVRTFEGKSRIRGATYVAPKEDTLDVRDRFALAALPELIAKAQPSDIIARDQAKVFSKLAYEIANAMMKERAE